VEGLREALSGVATGPTSFGFGEGLLMVLGGTRGRLLALGSSLPAAALLYDEAAREAADSLLQQLLQHADAARRDGKQ
jgi:hypothetical protein